MPVAPLDRARRDLSIDCKKFFCHILAGLVGLGRTFGAHFQRARAGRPVVGLSLLSAAERRI